MTIIGLLAFFCLITSLVLARASQIESWQEPDFDPSDSKIYPKGKFLFIKSEIFFYISLAVFGACVFATMIIFRN